MIERKRFTFKRFTALFLAVVLAMVPSVVVSGPVFAEEDPIVFKVRAAPDVYAGMPVFDNNPDHLDAYLDTLLDYVGLEGTVLYAIGIRRDFTLFTSPNSQEGPNPNEGKIVPGGIWFHDAAHGLSADQEVQDRTNNSAGSTRYGVGGSRSPAYVSGSASNTTGYGTPFSQTSGAQNGTDFPSIAALGQTWNTSLVNKVGEIMGNEKLSMQDWTQPSTRNICTQIATAEQDIRVNPLSGRLDESFAEDRTIAANMVSAMSEGVSGINTAGNTDKFWQKALVQTKHYTNYAAQVLRRQGSFYASARGMYEYHAQTPLNALRSGSLSGFMTSYGRTNGVPNMFSPVVQWAKSQARWGENGSGYLSPDYTSQATVYGNNTYGNGVDTRYAPDVNYTNVLALLGSASGIGDQQSENSQTYINAIIADMNAGTYGLTREMLVETAKDQLIPQVRCGFFNERDGDGYPAGYPFTDIIKNASDYSAFTPEHKNTALQAAQESIVLLKNKNNTLPISKSNSVYVSGSSGGAIFKTIYATGTRWGEVMNVDGNVSLSPVGGIKKVGGAGNVTYLSDTATNMTYRGDGEVVRIKTSEGKYIGVSNNTASAAFTIVNNAADAATFEKYSWGQQGYGYLCLNNKRFISNAATPAPAADLPNGGFNEIVRTYSNFPNRIRVEKNTDGTISYVLNGFNEDYSATTPATALYSGTYIAVNAGGTGLTRTGTLSNKTTAATLNTAATKFTEEIVIQAGQSTIDAAKDYAVVVVGTPARHCSSEGNDRNSLALGEEQYTQVANIASAYPGKTIVVISSNYPVIAQPFEDNDNVAAVLQIPYGGEYGGYALGQVIYGDAAPTGKLANTWYASDDALPPADAYFVGEGINNTVTSQNLDPRLTIDIVDGDPQQTNLTYMYTDADVTYEFGYGLTYSSFAYSGLSVTQDGDDFTAKVTVKNTGNVDTSEVVQLYVSYPDSSYGQYAPKQKLATFNKVFLTQGQSTEVVMNFKASDFALWDTNNNKLSAESGEYTFQVGSSSRDIRGSVNVNVQGEGYGALDATTEAVNVYDRSFASSEVIYREASRGNTVKNLADDVTFGGYYAVMSKKDGAWTALNNVDLKQATGVTVSVATLANTGGSLEIRLDSPTGTKVADVSIDKSNTASYSIEALNNSARNVAVNEVAYQDVSVEFDSQVLGVHDIYVVFTTPDMRIDTIQFTSDIDMSVLETLLERANEIDADNYTAVSYAVLESAINEAQTLLDKVGTETVTQQQINKAFNKLAAAYGGLVSNIDPGAVDKSELKIYIEMAEDILQSEGSTLRPAAKRQLEDMLLVAKFIDNSSYANQQMVDGSAFDLMSAIVNRKDIVDRSDLKELIAIVEELDSGKFKETGWITLTEALAKAKLVNDNSSVAEVTNAYKELQNAFNGLEFLPVNNKNALASALKNAKAILDDINSFVPSSVTGLAELYARAKAVYDSTDSTKIEVDTITRELVLACAKARAKEDRAALINTLAQIRSLNEIEYTASSYASLKNAMQAAQTVVDDKDATKDEVYNAYKVLAAAIDALELDVPGLPTNIQLKALSPTSIDLSWSKSSDADGYQIWYAFSPNGSYEKLVSTTGTSYKHNNLALGRTYYYKICSYKKVNGITHYSDYTDVKSLKLAVPVASVPTNVKTTSAGAVSIKVSWNKVSGASGYQIWRSTKQDGTYTKVATITSGSVTSYTSKDLKKGITYYYKVKAYNKVDNAEVSSGFSGTAKKKAELTKSTVTLKAGKNSVKISWKKVAGAKQYEIYRAISSNGTYKKIKTVSASKLSYTNSKLTKGKSYYYKVKAVEKVGSKTYKSAFSSKKSAKAK